jgi:hypothetical protein
MSTTLEYLVAKGGYLLNRGEPSGLGGSKGLLASGKQLGLIFFNLLQIRYLCFCW